MRFKSAYLICVILFLSLGFLKAEASSVGQDSLKFAKLDAKLDEYLGAISRESLDVQMQECDFIIGSASDSIVRHKIANKVYKTYAESSLMGAEAVAIHVFDRWFVDGGVKMDGDLAYMNAKIHADFNRLSLLGCKAPELMMKTFEGEEKQLFRAPDSRYSVLLFYDADCAKCKVQSLLLRNLLDAENYPVNFDSVYTGDDPQEWKEYVSTYLDVSSDAVSVSHLWDPRIDSDYQRKYGVIQTPRIFLIAPDGVIIGRGLDAKALSRMLGDIFKERALEYGTQESVSLFDMVFGADSEPSDRSEVVSVADHIASSTISKKDTVMFRQMTGDLLYYLSSKRGEAFKEGLDYLIDEYILSRPEVWRTQDDSLKVVGMAMLFDDLLSKAAPGSGLPAIKVPGELVSCRKTKNVVKALNKLGGRRNYIFFYAEGCNVCASEKEKMRAMMSDRRTASDVKVFLVNVDELVSGNPELSSILFDTFDLTSLPFILETDSRGVVLRRYISF